MAIVEAVLDLKWESFVAFCSLCLLMLEVRITQHCSSGRYSSQPGRHTSLIPNKTSISSSGVSPTAEGASVRYD